MSVWSEIDGKISFKQKAPSLRDIVENLESKYGCETVFSTSSKLENNIVTIEFRVVFDIDGKDAMNFVNDFVHSLQQHDEYRRCHFDFTSVIRHCH